MRQFQWRHTSKDRGRGVENRRHCEVWKEGVFGCEYWDNDAVPYSLGPGARLQSRPRTSLRCDVGLKHVVIGPYWWLVESRLAIVGARAKAEI